MKTLTASMIFLMVIAGCKTSSYVVDTKQSQVDYDFEEFDRYMEQRDCTIVFSSGEEEDAKEITSAKDSVSWSTFAKISAPVSQISLVRHSAATGETTVLLVDGRTRIVAKATHDSVWLMEPTRFTVPT